MKRVILTIVLFMALALLSADSSFVIAPGWNLSWNAHSVKLDDGSTLVAWIDSEQGTRAIRVQRFSPDGQAVWDEPVTVLRGLGSRYISKLLKSEGGDVIIVWSISVAPATSIFSAQKVNLAGDLLWDPEGVFVYTYTSGQQYRYASDGMGGFYMCALGGSSLYGVHLDASGASLWGEIPRLLLSLSDPSPFLFDMVADGSGGVILDIVISYPEYGQSGSGLFRFDFNGDPVGNTPLAPFHIMPYSYQTTTDSFGNLILFTNTWEDEHGFCFAFQKVSPSGIPLLPQFRLIPLGQGNAPMFMWVLPNADGGLVLVWSNRNAGIITFRVMALDQNFTQIWPGGHREIPTSEMNHYYIRFAMDASSGVYICWAESVGQINHFKTQYISGQGNVPWPEPLMLAEGTEHISSVMPSAHDDTALIFHDKTVKNRRGLYLRRLDESGFVDGDEGALPIVEGEHSYPANLGLTDVGSGYLSFWQKTLDGQPTIAYQLYDHAQQALLEPGGRLLNSGAGFNESELILEQVDAAKAALFYSVNSDSLSGTFLQEIDNLGNKLYPEPGIEVAVAGAKIGDQDGDIYIGWISDANGLQQLMGQRIHAGQKLWGASGRVLASFPAGTSASMQAVQGRYFIYRMDSSQGICRVLRVDGNGDLHPGWDPLGTPLISFPNLSYGNVYLSGMMQDKLMCFLEVFSPGFISTRMQLLSPEGNVLWGEQGLSFGFEWQEFRVTDAVFESDVTAVIPANGQIRVFKISPDGSMPFGENGHTLYDANTTVHEARIGKVADDLFSVAWSRRMSNSETYSDLYLCYMTQDGSMTDSGNIYIGGSLDRNHKLCLVNSGSQGFISWNDNRAGAWYYPGGNFQSGSVAGATFNVNGVDADDPLQVPAAPLVVEQNYTNPFNPSTTISFSLSKAASASLKIYNAKGQLVKILLAPSSLNAGNHSYVWDGLDDQDHPVATGLYLYRVNADGQSLTRKMMMIK